MRSNIMCRKLNFPVFPVLLLLCLAWGRICLAKIPTPVGFWRFEGSTADSGSGGNNGTLVGTATIVTDPQRGKCLQLDGDGYLNIPSGVAELGEADFTITAWIKTTRIGVPILSKSNGNGRWEENEKEMYVSDSDSSEADNDGTIEYVGHGCDWIRGSSRVDDGKWHHVAISWDIDEKKGLVYIDGQEGTEVVGFNGRSDNAADIVRIGFSESSHSSGNFVGRIDDVAIFDVTLSSEQLIELIQLSGGRVTVVLRPGKERAVTLDTDPHLVGWWRFDDDSGNTAADSSRYGRKGTLKGGLSFDKDSVSGKIGKALKLKGGDDLVEITNYKGVTGTRPRTVSAWIKTTTSRGDLISWGLEDYGQMWIFRFIRGRIGVTPRGGYLYMNSEVHDDKWHHVAAVVEDAKLPNLHDDVKLYKDGAPAESHDIGLLDLWPINTGSDLDVTIGRGFKGLIDDVRIYDRALSPDEISAIFRLKTSLPK